MAEEPEKTAVEEPEKPPEKKEEEPEAELSDLEKREQELIAQEEEETGEKPPESSEEFEELDWDQLKEKHPEIEKLGIKNMADLVDKYFGGLQDFQKNAEIVKDLKKLGYETPAEREELFKKLSTKEEAKTTEKKEETTEKTFADKRRESLSALLPKEVMDPDSEEPRALTEEEKKAYLERTNRFADAIMPADLPDTVDRVGAETTDLRDDLAWALFQLQPVLEKFKDEVVPTSVRGEIREHSKRFPRTYMDIVEAALKNGENFYTPVYHHFMTNTKRDLIEAEKRKRWEQERDEEDKKKKDAKTETAKKRKDTTSGPKSWKEMTLAEKEADLRRQEAEEGE